MLKIDKMLTLSNENLSDSTMEDLGYRIFGKDDMETGLTGFTIYALDEYGNYILYLNPEEPKRNHNPDDLNYCVAFARQLGFHILCFEDSTHKGRNRQKYKLTVFADTPDEKDLFATLEEEDAIKLSACIRGEFDWDDVIKLDDGTEIETTAIDDMQIAE